MPFFRSPLPTLLAGILFAGTGAGWSATPRNPNRRDEPEPEPGNAPRRREGLG
ncbi:MAG: hypothetical protein P4L36_17750 [Holophaga sp.]|nr:hypothetical protein [Holophaga sp.]